MSELVRKVWRWFKLGSAPPALHPVPRSDIHREVSMDRPPVTVGSSGLSSVRASDILSISTGRDEIRKTASAQFTTRIYAYDPKRVVLDEALTALQGLVRLLDGQTEPLHPVSWQVELEAAKRALGRQHG